MFKSYAVAAALVLSVSAPALAQGFTEFRVRSLEANAYEIQAAEIALSKTRNPAVRAYAEEAIRDHRSANAALVGGERNYDRLQGADAGSPVGGILAAPLAVAGGAVGAATGAAAGVVGGTLSGGPVGGLEGAGTGAARGAQVGSNVGQGEVVDTGSTVVAPSPAQQAMLSDLSATPAGPAFDSLYVQQQLQSHQQAIAMTRSYAASGPSPVLRTYAQQALPVYEHHYRAAQQLQQGM